MMTFQAKLTTKLAELSVDNTVIDLKTNVDSKQLNVILKSLLSQLDIADKASYQNKTFEFLVGGRILLQSVDQHLELYSGDVDVGEILSENVVKIEYFLSSDPPKAVQSVPHEDWVSAVHADQDYIITGSYDNSISIFSSKDRSLLLKIPNAHKKPITRVFITKSNKQEVTLISCSHDETAIQRKVNIATKKHEIITTFKGHTRSVDCMDVFGNLMATGSFDKTLRLWAFDQVESNHSQNKGQKKRKLAEETSAISQKNTEMTLTGHHEPVTGVKFLDGCHDYNSLATCSMDNTIMVWDIEVGEAKHKFLSSKPLLDIDYSNENGLLLAACCDRHIRAWDSRAPDAATAKTAYTSHAAWVKKVSFGHRNQMLFISGGYDNLVKLWDIRSPKACLFDLIGHHDKVLDVTWNNSDYVFSGSADSTLGIYSTIQ